MTNRKSKILKILMVVFFFSVPVSVFALDAYPLERSGSCPLGYHQTGNYCSPNNSGSNFAIERKGACPIGYHQSGGYCLANSNNERRAIPRSGACPIGYHQSGNYCVEN